ncbi:TPA: hypothetical protein ACJCAQ_003656 [Salmonella enterica subsp. enterica]|uniref:hypothetical protein n=1 Tax=Salmonella enterica TaxID=28901 RepID=UPI001EF1052C
MVRQRASAGGRRNVVQTAHDLRRISLLTDTPPGRAFVAGESAFLSTDRRLSITFARLISPFNSG